MNDVWDIFFKKYNFSEKQKKQYQEYVAFLLQENEKYNLTRITDLDKIISHHLIDSLECAQYDYIKNSSCIADIGSGCGVPGIPLAIFFPEKKFILVEVVQKKINFLNHALVHLGITNCIVSPYDYLTFIRTYRDQSVNVFLSRAALHIHDLIKVFFDKGSLHKKSIVVYWGSEHWREKEFVNNKHISYKQYPYAIEDKKRFYVTISK